MGTILNGYRGMDMARCKTGVTGHVDVLGDTRRSIYTRISIFLVDVLAVGGTAKLATAITGPQPP
jgi:hypothetical protein